MLSNGDVDRFCVLMQGKYIYTFKMYICPRQNRAQNITQCHDNKIRKQICIKKLSHITETYLRYNLQRGKTGRKIHVSSTSEIGPIPKK